MNLTRKRPALRGGLPGKPLPRTVMTDARPALDFGEPVRHRGSTITHCSPPRSGRDYRTPEGKGPGPADRRSGRGQVGA